MSLQRFLYGDDSPTAVHQVMTGILVICFILAIYGLFIDFIPDPAWTGGGGFFAGSLLAILWIGSKAIGQQGRTQRYYASSASTGESLLAGLTRSTFYFAMIWLAVVHGFAGLVTRSIGHDFNTRVAVETQVSLIGGTCDYQITGPAIVSGATRYLCISYYDYTHWPRELEVRLQGRRSGLGLTVDNIIRVTPAAPAP